MGRELSLISHLELDLSAAHPAAGRPGVAASLPVAVVTLTLAVAAVAAAVGVPVPAASAAASMVVMTILTALAAAPLVESAVPLVIVVAAAAVTTVAAGPPVAGRRVALPAAAPVVAWKGRQRTDELLPFERLRDYCLLACLVRFWSFQLTPIRVVSLRHASAVAPHSHLSATTAPALEKDAWSAHVRAVEGWEGRKSGTER